MKNGGETGKDGPPRKAGQKEEPTHLRSALLSVGDQRKKKG